MADPNDFTGGHLHYGGFTQKLEDVRRGIGSHSTKWRNRRPICPYGCGEEGQLLEIIMKEGKALGIYEDSCKCKFTADLQMAPKPTGHKLQKNASGEMEIVPDN